jgi:hypothetical protein
MPRTLAAFLLPHVSLSLADVRSVCTAAFRLSALESELLSDDCAVFAGAGADNLAASHTFLVLVYVAALWYHFK